MTRRYDDLDPDESTDTIAAAQATARRSAVGWRPTDHDRQAGRDVIKAIRRDVFHQTQEDQE